MRHSGELLGKPPKMLLISIVSTLMLLALQGCASPILQAPVPKPTISVSNTATPVPLARAAQMPTSIANEDAIQRSFTPFTTTTPSTIATRMSSQTASRGFITYTVQPGDTLHDIAGAYGLLPETVLWSNYGALKDNPDLLSVGMELLIPPSDGLIATVVEGDSIDALARQFQVTPEDIVNEPSNQLTSVNQVLIAGQELFIPGGRRETVVWQLPKPVEVGQRPVSTAPPAVSGWIADYRPNWIGFLYTSGSLIRVTPDGQGGTTAQTIPGWFYTFQYKPGDQVVVTQPDKTGHIVTWVFKPGTQNEFNQMLTQWQQTLKLR